MKATKEYKKGDGFLCLRSVGGLIKRLVETEIIDVSVEASAIRD